MSDVNVNVDNNLSPAPGVPQTPYKAYAATVLAFVTIFVSAWIADDNGTNFQEVLTWVISALVGSGITGATTYQVKNKATGGVRR